MWMQILYSTSPLAKNVLPPTSSYSCLCVTGFLCCPNTSWCVTHGSQGEMLVKWVKRFGRDLISFFEGSNTEVLCLAFHTWSRLKSRFWGLPRANLRSVRTPRVHLDISGCILQFFVFPEYEPCGWKKMSCCYPRHDDAKCCISIWRLWWQMLGKHDLKIFEILFEMYNFNDYTWVLYGTVWYCMVLYGTVWYCMVLYGTVWYCMVLYGTVWYCMVLYGPMVLYGTVWYCMVLYGTVWYCYVVRLCVICHPLSCSQHIHEWGPSDRTPWWSISQTGYLLKAWKSDPEKFQTSLLKILPYCYILLSFCGYMMLCHVTICYATLDWCGMMIWKVASWRGV